MVNDDQDVMWDLSPLFDGDEDARMVQQRKLVEEQIMKFVKKWKDREDYLEDAEVLKEALDEYELWSGKYGVSGAEGYYWHLRVAQEQDNAVLKGKMNKMVEFATRLHNEIQFFEIRLAKVSIEKQKQFLADERLSNYRHWLENLFSESKYILSEDVEKVLNLKSVTAYVNWVKMTEEFVAKEEGEVLNEKEEKTKKSFSEILSLINNKNKDVRDKAAATLNSILLKHLDVAEIELNSVLQDKKINDELRGFERPDKARHLADDIDSEVVDILVEAVSRKFDIAQNYYKLKAKVMGVEKLGYHERNVPVGSLTEKYDWQKSKNLVSKVLRNLDDEFGGIFDAYVEKGQLDVFPRKGKTSGAFCSHDLITQPTYILLNHTDQLNDVLTLAHEVGHGIHNELMKKNQNALNFGTPKSTAEVASTFMEDFVLQELAKQASKEQKFAIQMMKLNDDISTIFRQVAFYKFEQELHEKYRNKGFLSKDEIGSLFTKHMKAYMGEGVEQSPGSENWWIYVGHFRMYFYVYSYASGLLISKSLQNKVKKDLKFVEQVKRCLEQGTSAAPKDIFSNAGLDISDAAFWKHGLIEVENLLNETGKLAKDLGVI